MSGDRIARALARIEAAAERIEAAANTLALPDPALERRYLALRREAAEALAEIDRLIGTLER
jgi:hypothetical protein